MRTTTGNRLRLLTGALICWSAASSGHAGDRVMEAKDIPGIRSAQDPQVSPDGHHVAFVLPMEQLDAAAKAGHPLQCVSEPVE